MDPSRLLCPWDSLLEWLTISFSRESPNSGGELMFPVSPALAGVFFTTEPPEKSSRNCSRGDMVQWPYHCPMADNSNSASYIADAHLRLMRKEDRYGTEKEKYRLWVWAECGTRGSPSLKQWMTNKVQQKESMSNHRYKEHLQRRRWENKRKFEDCRFMPGTLENQTKWELNNSLVVCLIEVVEDVEINYLQRNYLNVSVGTRSH